MSKETKKEGGKAAKGGDKKAPKQTEKKTTGDKPAATKKK